MTTKSPPAHNPARRAVPLLAIAVALVASVLFGSSAAPAAPRGQALAAISQAVHQSGVRGIAWYADAAAGQVVVTADSTVSEAQVATIKRAAAGDSGAIRVERAAGVFRSLVSAGDAIYGARFRCSLGFNVVQGNTFYFLTAGHCGKSEKRWYTSANQSTLIGPTINYSFPKNDYALVRYDNASLTHPGGFTVADAFVGESVKRTGSTTGTHSGTVTALNVTVRYQGGGVVSGMIQTTVCAEPGDSGGPLYDGSKALGITSGGSGDCESGGTTFFQPVREAVQAYGVTIY